MPHRKPGIRDYLVVVGSVAAVSLVRAPLMRHGINISYMPYLLAIVVSALVAGWPGGLTAIGLSVLAGTLFRVNVRKFDVHSSSDLITLALFVLCGLGISAISQRQGVARREAEQSSSDARERERQLRKSEDRYRKLINDANEGMMNVDAKETITSATPSVAEMMGFQ